LRRTPTQGDLVLRAGTYLNSKDARFSLRGVYVVESASLHAVAEPEEPLSAALHPSELRQHTSDYRHGPRSHPCTSPADRASHSSAVAVSAKFLDTEQYQLSNFPLYRRHSQLTLVIRDFV
jgi:hypothetical protein